MHMQTPPPPSSLFFTRTHKHPFHAQLMEDLLGWITALAAALLLAWHQDLAPETTVGL